MRILITGVTGFVGSHLAESLVEAGYDVHGLARYVSERGGLESGQVTGVTYHIGDIMDPFSVRSTVADVDPDVIFHLATQSSVEYSFNHPYHSYNVGFLGTVHMAEAAMEATTDLKRFIFASSVEVYGNREEFPFHEEMNPQPASPYGVAKTASEEYLRYLHRCYDFPVVQFRSSNTYGRKQNTRFVIERTLNQMINGVEQVELGDPDPVRDFLFIEDEVRAFKRILEAGEKVNGEVFNTGTKRGVSIKELADIIADMTDYNGTISWNSNSHRPLEIHKLVADYEKLNEYVGWEPEYSLRDGLQETVRMWSP